MRSLADLDEALVRTAREFPWEVRGGVLGRPAAGPVRLRGILRRGVATVGNLDR